MELIVWIFTANLTLSYTPSSKAGPYYTVLLIVDHNVKNDQNNASKNMDEYDRKERSHFRAFVHCTLVVTVPNPFLVTKKIWFPIPGRWLAEK